MSCGAIAGAAGLIGQVVCLGADGHVEVEFSRNAKCNQFPGKALAAASLDGFDFSSIALCGPCLDVGLNVTQIAKSDDFYDRVWLTSLPAPCDLTALPTNRVAQDAPVIPRHSQVNSAPLHSTLRERRTVVIQV